MWTCGRGLSTLKSALALAALSFATVIIGCPMTPPSAKGVIFTEYLEVGKSDTIDASDYFFTGMNAGRTEYSVRSENTLVVEVDINSSTITMTAIATGTAKISVTATNGAGSAQQSFTVIVTEGSADPPKDQPMAPPIVPPNTLVPPPVDLGISNILQETDVWCWAAVSQQIILHLRGVAATPAQCYLVGVAYNAYPPSYCCPAPGPLECRRTGTLGQIQFLIGRYGGRYSTLAPPTDAMTLYRILSSRRPVIVHLQQTPYVGHVVVVRGMEWRETPTGIHPIVYVNDPLSYFSRPVAFESLLRFWRTSIVVEP